MKQPYSNKENGHMSVQGYDFLKIFLGQPSSFLAKLIGCIILIICLIGPHALELVIPVLGYVLIIDDYQNFVVVVGGLVGIVIGTCGHDFIVGRIWSPWITTDLIVPS